MFLFSNTRHHAVDSYSTPTERDLYVGVAGLKVVATGNTSSSSGGALCAGSSMACASSSSMVLAACASSCATSSTSAEVTSQTMALGPAGADAIAELSAAYRRSLDIQMDRADLPRDQASFADLVNIAELSVRRVIAMAKQVVLVCVKAFLEIL